MIKIQNLTVQYPEQTDKALQDIFVTFEADEIVLLAGPNGGGKSTLIKALSGVIPHIIEGTIEGAITLKDASITNYSTSQLAGRMGLVLQEPDSQISNLTIEDEVAFGPSNLLLPEEVIKNNVEQSLRAMEINHLKKVSVLTLSGGQMQRLSIASLLAMDPDILILDEPVSNLDPLGVISVVEAISLLKNRVKLVIIASHWLDPFITLATRIIVMSSGSIVIDSSIEDVKSRLDDLVQYGVQLPQTWILEKKLSHAYILQPHTSHSVLNKDVYLSLADVSYRFKDNTYPTIQHVTLSINEHERTAFVGHNGEGKTTLARLIAGLIKPTSGIVKRKSPKVSMMLQKPSLGFLCNTVLDELTFNNNLTEEQAKNLLAELGLINYLARSPFQLSGGEQRRLAFAIALANKSDLLILDESTAGLDAKQVDVFLNMLDAFNGVVVHITHDTRIVGKVDTITVLRKGTVLYNGEPFNIPPSILEYVGYDKVNPTVQLALTQLEYGIPFLPEQLEVANGI